jgi:hypothetical protein
MSGGLADIAVGCARLCRSIIDEDVEAIVRSSSRILAVALSAITGTGSGDRPIHADERGPRRCLAYRCDLAADQAALRRCGETSKGAPNRSNEAQVNAAKRLILRHTPRITFSQHDYSFALTSPPTVLLLTRCSQDLGWKPRGLDRSVKFNRFRSG